MIPMCPICGHHNMVREMGVVSYIKQINQIIRTHSGSLVSSGEAPEPSDELQSYRVLAYQCMNCWYESPELEQFVPGPADEEVA